MHNKEKYFCRICGLEQEDPPWGEDGKTASFEICCCCGVEFGYEDVLLEGIQEYRKDWIEEGGEWSDSSHRPLNWNLNEQLKQIPKLYF
jgi:hypothetical protein